MTRFLPALLLLPALASAQAPLDLDRIERPWPMHAIGSYSFAGVDLDLCCGSFVPGHLGRCAVVLRDQSLYLAFQPAAFDHFAGVGQLGATAYQAIAALSSLVGGPDRLATVDAAGLRTLLYSDTLGFVPATPQAPLASWVGVRDLRVTRFSPLGVAQNFVLGISPTLLRVASVDAADAMAPLAELLAPPFSQVLDAELVDWSGDPSPEIAMLLTTGCYIFDLAGNALASFPASVDAGKLCRLRDGSTPALCMITHSVGSGSAWSVNTWEGGGAPILRSGGTLNLPADVVGIAAFDMDGNADLEVVISATDSVRYLLGGSSTGPQASLLNRVADVRPEKIPVNPAANLVPLVLDDIDRDGTVDFVIAQSASNQLVVMPRARPQLNFFINGNSDDGDAVPTVALEAVLGQDSTVGPWAFPASINSREGLGLRLRIPEGSLLGTRVEAFLYPIEDGNPPSGSDPCSSQASDRFQFTLPDNMFTPPIGAAGRLVDVMLPVLPSQRNSNFVLEVNLLGPGATVPGDTTTPLLMQHVFVPEPGVLTWFSMPSIVNPTWWALWSFEGVSLPQPKWNLGQSRIYGINATIPVGVPPEYPVGNRYIGLLVPVKSAKVTSLPPKVPTAETVTSSAKVAGQ